MFSFLCQAEDGIRDLVRSRGLGDVYKRQGLCRVEIGHHDIRKIVLKQGRGRQGAKIVESFIVCLLYTSDAADERSSVDLGGRRIIKKKTNVKV